jgi:hypothetical protein
VSRRGSSSVVCSRPFPVVGRSFLVLVRVHIPSVVVRRHSLAAAAELDHTAAHQADLGLAVLGPSTR